MARTLNSFGNYNGFSVNMTQMFFENGADLMIPVTAATPLPVTSVAGGSVVVTPTSGALTDKSGTIATGGTAQTAAALNASRKYLFIKNPDTAASSIWYSTTATAVADSPSIELVPGAAWENPSHYCPTGALSVIGATTGQKFVAREA